LLRLVARGLLALSGFTPSDAAHVLGLQLTWSAEAAFLGNIVWQRFAESHLLGPWEGDFGFSRHVLDQVALQAGRCLVTSALGEQHGQALRDLTSLQQDFIDAALGPGSGQELLGVTFSLKRPLVAIGAPVATYYPQVAERLHTRLCIPDYAAIANAVGAIAGGVVQRITVHITPLGEAAFRVHSPSGVETFPTLEEAAAYAVQESSRLADARAREAGAMDVQLQTQRMDNVVNDGCGFSVFFESIITATAYGRPRVARSSAA
jgi:N-methylhydantoinase A/oxoprolinase/acetone carboxylase beta subunit